MAVGAAVAIGGGPPPPRPLLLILTGLPDAARRRGGQGVRHRVGPRRRLLRLGDRPRVRRPAARWRRLVPGQPPTPATSSLLPVAVLAVIAAHLLPAGQGRVARASRPRAASWSGPSASSCSASACSSTRCSCRAVDHAGADPGHRGAALREGVATGERRAPPGPSRQAPGRARGRPAPTRSGRQTSPVLAAPAGQPPHRPDRGRATRSAETSSRSPPSTEPARPSCAACPARWPSSVRPGQLHRRRGVGRAAPARRAQPAAGPRPGLHRSTAASGRPPDLRVLRPLLGRLVPAAQDVARPRSTPGSAVEGYDHIERAMADGHRPDPGPAPPGRLGVGRASG